MGKTSNEMVGVSSTPCLEHAPRNHQIATGWSPWKRARSRSATEQKSG